MNSAIIYKIYNLENPEICYIGCTKMPLKIRLSVHLSSYKRWKTDKSLPLCSSYKIFELGNYKTEELEKVEDHSKISEREYYWFNVYRKSCVNISVPNRTSLMYYYDHRETRLNELQEKYKNNKEFKYKVNQYARKYYQDNIKSSNPLSEFKRLSSIKI